MTTTPTMAKQDPAPSATVAGDKTLAPIDSSIKSSKAKSEKSAKQSTDALPPILGNASNSSINHKANKKGFVAAVATKK